MGFTILSIVMLQQKQVQMKKGTVSSGFRPISWFNKWESSRESGSSVSMPWFNWWNAEQNS